MLTTGRLLKSVLLMTALAFGSNAQADEGFTWFGQTADGNWLAGAKLSSVQHGRSGYEDAVNLGLVLGYQFSRVIGLSGTSSLEFEFNGTLDDGNISSDGNFGASGEWNTDNYGLYFNYRSTGSVYFLGKLGLLKSDITSELNGFADFAERDTMFSYGAGLGVHLGQNSNFNLELELVGTNGDNDLNMISIGGIYLFP